MNVLGKYGLTEDTLRSINASSSKEKPITMSELKVNLREVCSNYEVSPNSMGRLSTVALKTKYKVTNQVLEDILLNGGVFCKFYIVETPVGFAKVLHFRLSEAIPLVHKVLSNAKQVTKTLYTHELVGQRFRLQLKEEL